MIESSNYLNNKIYIENVNKKMINNAISAYLMIFISWLFLFNKTNKNIDNDFVISHVKTASIIHLGFFIVYIIFVSFGLLSEIVILGYGLNHIIAMTLFLFLLGLIVIGIFKSNKKTRFNIYKNISISKDKAILDINGDGNISENEKLTILLSFVPLIGFVNFGKYKNNLTIQDSTRLNIITTLVITLLYIFSYYNLANILSLIYIIFIVFVGINLFTRDELIQIKLPKYLSPEKLYRILNTSKKYLQNYFSEKNFRTFKIINNEKINTSKILEEKNEKILSSKKDIKQSSVLIYIPVINLIFIFFKKTKYSFHIINGITITILLAITGILAKYGYFNAKLHILSLFPILFGIGYTKNRLAYKMPIIFDIYLSCSKFVSLFKIGTKKINSKRKEENEISLKVNNKTNGQNK